jgi:hypothetical protein
MSSPRGFSLLLTASQAAGRLGVAVETVLGWAAAGRLRIAGQDEEGRALFRESVIDSRGEELAALTLPALGRLKRKPNDKQPHTERGLPLPCGCNLARSPLHLCRTGAALNAALQLAETLAAAVPDDPLLRKLAELCREALKKHLMPAADVTTAPAGETEEADAGEVASARSQRTETASEERMGMAVS